jgi:flagellar hook protein FlgE
MAFQTGLSGLGAAAQSLDVIGNNVANASTAGFKESRAIFADVYSNSLSGAGTSPVGIGTKVAAVQQQFTQGNITVTNNPLDVAVNGNGFFQVQNNGAVFYSRNGQFHQDSAGNIVNADNMSLLGYAADASGAIVASTPVPLQISNAQITPGVTANFKVNMNIDSRATMPSAQTAGVLTGTGGAIVFPLTVAAGVNDTLAVTLNGVAGTATIAPATYASSTSLSAAVQSAINAVGGVASAGYSASVAASGNVLTITSNQTGTGSALNITGGSAQAALGLGTFNVTAGADNFSTSNAASFNNSNSGTVYDSLGNPHVLTFYYIKSAFANGQWKMYAGVDSTPLSNVDLGAGAGVPVNITFNNAGALTTAMPISPVALTIGGGAATPLSFALDFSGSTQFGAAFAVNSLTQDGYASGRLSGFNVSGDGIIVGTYTNGQSKNLGQITLASFANPEGLQPLGNNTWAQTSGAGLPIIGTPDTGSLGKLQSAAIEESNVDLTSQLVNMITAQRVYQANAQTIKTQDAVLQTLVNLR